MSTREKGNGVVSRKTKCLLGSQARIRRGSAGKKRQTDGRPRKNHYVKNLGGGENVWEQNWNKGGEGRPEV